MSTPVLEKLTFNRICVMEDDEEWRGALRRTLKGYGADVSIASSEEEAVQLAQNGVRNFILDVNMGPDKHAQEGLNAAERIKAYDNEIFVCILTGYPDFRRQAQKLRVNHFEEKTKNRSADISRSVQAMLVYAGQEVRCAAKRLGWKGEPTLEIWGDDPQPNPLADKNFVAFRKLREDHNWVAEHAGCFVAFVGGKLVDSRRNRADLLSAVRKAYPGKRRFVTQVTDEVVVEELPSPEVVDSI